MIEIAAVCDRATVLREGETVGVVDVTAGSEERIVELMLGQIVEDDARRGERRARPHRAGVTPRLAARGLASGTKLEDVNVRALPGRGARASWRSKARARTSCSTSSRVRRARARGELLVDGSRSRSGIRRTRSVRGSCTSRPIAPRRC